MKISICIPAYGRQRQLGELVDSLIRASMHPLNRWSAVEVVVSDNATEPPLEIARGAGLGEVSLILHRQIANVGPSRNFIEAAVLATGDYCWWMGSDDVVMEDALVSIYDVVTSRAECGVFVFDRIDWVEGRGEFTRRWYSGVGEMYDLASEEGVVGLFENSLGVGGVFSYLGSLVFKRSVVSLERVPDSIYRTAYSHVYVLLRARAKVLTGLPSVVKCRLGDDSFAGSGAFGRLFVDIDGYATIADECGLSVAAKKYLDKVVFKEVLLYLSSFRHVAWMALMSRPEDRQRLKAWLARHGGGPFHVRLALICPVLVFKIVRKLMGFARHRRVGNE
jgi:abequosyltransferase